MRSVKEMTGLKRRRNIMIARTETGLHATGALCKHMAWPLAWGGKIGDCITCPLHQSKYDICSGDVKEWSPISTPAHVWEDARKNAKGKTAGDP